MIRCVMMACVLMGLMGKTASTASAYTAVENDNVNSSAGPNVSIGIDGFVRLGKWVPIYVNYDSAPNEAPVKYEISVLDCDDAPIAYCGDLIPVSENKYQGLARIGRSYGNAELRLLDGSGQAIETVKLPFRGEDKAATITRSTRPLIATIEPNSEFKSAIESYSLVGKQEDSPIVVRLGDLPTNQLGYDSVETILLVTSDLEQMKQYSKQQIEALMAWVKNGGTLVVSASKNGQQLLADGGLLEPFCPGNFDGLAQCASSKMLERFMLERFNASVDQLIAKRGTVGGEPIPMASLSDATGKVLVAVNKKPLIINRAIGLGEVLFFGIDLDSDRMKQWSGRDSLVGLLVTLAETSVEDQVGQKAVKGTSVSTFGYEDLIGQLRAPLDRFTNVKFVAFTWIALLIGLYILCIGPGDFFFLKKLLKKMELTWITFPLLSLLFCGLALGISRMTRPSSIQINQLEIIDIDTIQGWTQGSVWANLYSPSGGSRNISIDRKHNLGFEIDSDVLSWHGLPGDGLGGMWSSPTPGLSKTGYRQTIELGDAQQPKVSIESLPLQVSSTKPMFGQWWSGNDISRTSRLTSDDKKNGGTGLSGTVTNPLPYQLKNCRLVFRDWAYVLDSTFDPGDTFDVRTEPDEKKLSALLTRRFTQSDEGNKSNNTAWNPTDTNIGRIASMMMFYEAAGGNNYTGLTHRYQPFMDMSRNLYLNRAVLVGEIEQIGAELLVDEKRVTDNYDQSRTIVRIILPVKIK